MAGENAASVTMLRKSSTGFTAHHDLDGWSPGSALRHTDVTRFYVCSFFLVAAGTPVAFISSPNEPCPNLKVYFQLRLPVSSGMVTAGPVQVLPVFLAT